MNKVINTRGLPACGKTTWAKDLQKQFPGKYKRVNKDDLRMMFDDYELSKENEIFVNKISVNSILISLEEGKDVIVDDTNLNSHFFEELVNTLKDKAEIEIKDFCDMDVEVCIERDRKRERKVGEKVIREMWEKFIKERKD